MKKMKGIRCKKCHKLLGFYTGQGVVKCTRSECGTLNNFDTENEENKVATRNNQAQMYKRTTSSGMVFR